MKYTYRPKAICASLITVDVEDNKVVSVDITGGCPGNLAAIPKILEGWNADEVVARLAGNDCRGRGTSCADQLTKAIVEAQKKMKE